MTVVIRKKEDLRLWESWVLQHQMHRLYQAQALVQPVIAFFLLLLDSKGIVMEVLARIQLNGIDQSQ
jgi:hypothetical protein